MMLDSQIIIEFNELRTRQPGNWRECGYAEGEISNAERKFGRLFDVQYKTFLKLYGACCLGQHTIVGISPFTELSINMQDIFEINLTVKRYLDYVDFQDWFIIGDDTNGNFWTMNAIGNIGFLDHDDGEIVNRYCSFSNWIIQYFYN